MRCATTATAPRALASARKSSPSPLWPEMAKKRNPGPTARLSALSPEISRPLSSGARSAPGRSSSSRINALRRRGAGDGGVREQL